MKTHKFSTVLIALDYDPTAQIIAEIGFAIAVSMNAKVVLLHVISEPIYYSSREYSPIMGFDGFIDSGSFQTNEENALQNAALDFLEKSKQHLGGENIQIKVAKGDFADSILKTAVDLKADMIVMGSHSQKWLEKIVMGSVTEEVLNHTTIPLFIIPTKKG